MALYTRMAGVNVCIARAAGVEFDKAAAIAGETIAQVIQDQHGRVIAVVSKQPLTLEDLRRGTFNSAVLAAVEICPNQVPPGVLKDVQAALERAEPSPAAPPGRAPQGASGAAVPGRTPRPAPARPTPTPTSTPATPAR